MNFLSQLEGSFTGSTAKKKLDQANAQATGYLNQGKTEATNALSTNYQQAQGYLSPYAQQGQQANSLYGQAIGLQGPQARQQFMDQYATGDPFRQFNEDNGSRALSRRYAAMGYGPGGGTMGLAMARAQLERGSQDYEGYLNRLGGAAGQGMGAANQQAQLAGNYGGQMAGLHSGFAQQNAANAINYGNASAQNSNALFNNILGLGSVAVSAMTGMPKFGVGGGGANTYMAGGKTYAHA